MIDHRYSEVSVEPRHHQISANGVELHLVSQGEGPLVILCHGYPGLWYSWRHQLPALAAAGFQAVAMDMRGYGRSSRPTLSDHYDFDCQSADLLAVMDHFGAESAVLCGHDFGANLTWHMAEHHSERLRGVAVLCVPYGMALAGGCDQRPSELFAEIARQHFFHMHYYQAVGVAERAVLGRERDFLQRLLWALCADGDLLDWSRFPMAGTDYIEVLAPPGRPLPWSWLSQADFEFYLAEYLRAGPSLTFAGGANAYRVMDRNWLRYGPVGRAEISLPALFVGGQEDPVVKLGSPADFDNTREKVRDLRGLELLPGAGHFPQQEQPEALNRLLLDFLAGL